MKTMTFAATGDSFITRRLPPEYEDFREVANLIQGAEVRFTNLEVTTHHYEGPPAAVSGGTWAIASPKVLEDLKRYGFNLVAWANNHTLDYSIGGLCATEKYLNQYEFVHSGVGNNLAMASQPNYLETKSGRVALIAATSSFHESSVAGEQRPDMIGRPGINPLRFQTIHKISPEKMKQLRRIAEVTDINASQYLSIKEGFLGKRNDDIFSFGHYLFQEDENEGQHTSPHLLDLNRIKKSIIEAKRQADYVLVSIHAHEMKGEEKEQPADFIQIFARECIDAGAHAVIGHGPHIVRGIEIYKSRPIFYSLGNFIFQNETVSGLPSDFYGKYGLDHTHNVADAFDARSKQNTIGFGVNPDIWSSVIPYWKMRGDELEEIQLYPIELGFSKSRYQRGWPSLVDNTIALERLQRLSMQYGTNIEIENGIGRINVNNI